jgi:asparaginyl-tRNA synthetase
MSYALYIDCNDARALRLEIAAALRGVKLAVTHTTAAELFGFLGPQPAVPPRLPALRVPGGQLLSGADAILRRLCDGAGGGPAADVWAEWASRELDPLLSGGGAAAALPPLLATLARHLSSRTFLSGERLGAGDVAVAGTLAALEREGALAPALAAAGAPPALRRWLATCLHAPAFVAVLGRPAVAEAAVAPAGAAAPAAAPAPASAPARGAAAVAAVRADGGVSALVPSALTAFATTLPAPLYARYRQRVADVLLAGEALAGAEVTVCGWARTVREAGAGKLLFIALNDGSVADSLQVVAEAGKTDGFAATAAAGGVHASFRVRGTVVKSPAKGQPIELAAAAIEVLGGVADPATYPLAKKRHTPEYLRDLPHLRPRTALISAVARIRNACAYAIHRFFQDRGFAYVHTPIVTGADCEGAGEMFQVTTLLAGDGNVPRVKAAAPPAPAAAAAAAAGAAPPPPAPVDYSRDFFGKPVSLTVSGQLQVETYAQALADVYTFGPTFRAELSHTSRHLAEFWMIEPEIAFATLADDMALAEDFLKFATRFVLEHCDRDIAFFETAIEPGLRSRLLNVVAEPFQRLTYTEAVDLLLQPEHVRAAAGGGARESARERARARARRAPRRPSTPAPSPSPPLRAARSWRRASSP